MSPTRDVTPRALLPWKRPGTPLWLAAGIGVVVMLMLGVVAWESRQPPSDRARRARVAELAVLHPPQPSPEAIRASAGDTRYAHGLEAYAARRWAEAVDSLGGIDRPDARFYLALAHLMRDEADTADELLLDVQQSAATLYAREAVFYRVKALLARQDARGAQALVQDAVRIGAGPPGEAERLRDALEILRP